MTVRSTRVKPRDCDAGWLYSRCVFRYSPRPCDGKPNHWTYFYSCVPVRHMQNSTGQIAVSKWVLLARKHIDVHVDVRSRKSNTFIMQRVYEADPAVFLRLGCALL